MNNNIGPSITGWIIVINVILLILYNVFAFWMWGQDATISKVMEHKMMNFPVIALVIGIILGHWLKF
jgi:hypothetical protein